MPTSTLLKAASGALTKARPAEVLPANPFVIPTPENTDLSFLTVASDHLPYAVEFYETRRQLREAVVLNYTKRKERGPEAWAELVAEASASFEPRDWMLPACELREPGVIKGIYDYIPIAHTAPELYSPEHRKIMQENGRRPWMFLVMLNARWHTADSFLHWVDSSLVPEVVKSARHLADTHFRETTGEGAPAPAFPVRRRLRPRARPAASRADSLSTPRLRERLLSLAAHRIRHSAAPGEPLRESYRRYRDALPRGADERASFTQFCTRVDRVASDSRADWLRHFVYESRLRAALEQGLLHLAA